LDPWLQHARAPRRQKAGVPQGPRWKIIRLMPAGPNHQGRKKTKIKRPAGRSLPEK
jgi:hypothetical protein